MHEHKSTEKARTRSRHKDFFIRFILSSPKIIQVNFQSVKIIIYPKNTYVNISHKMPQVLMVKINKLLIKIQTVIFHALHKLHFLIFSTKYLKYIDFPTGV